MADNSNKFIVKYRQNSYDISDFVHKHPGGTNAFKGLQNADMTERFMKAPPHSAEAMYLMQEYKIRVTDPSSKQKLNDQVGTELKENIENIEEPEHDDNSNSNNNNSSSKDDNNIKNSVIDESMEHLVDWSKPMLSQISGIVEYYDEWVHKPVDRPLRFFEPWYLEMFTKTPWWLIPTFWLPVITKLLYDELIHELRVQTTFKSTFLTLYFVSGIFLWTFVEYAFNRCVFHMKLKPIIHPWLCTFHFAVHGIHHKLPLNPVYAVLHPLPGAIVMSLLYGPIALSLPQPRLILAGVLFGYLCYDLIHYYIHYGSPSNNHLYHMKRYHYQHNFAHQDMGYGVTTLFWDLVFNTRIHLRKLRFHLKWK